MILKDEKPWKLYLIVEEGYNVKIEYVDSQ